MQRIFVSSHANLEQEPSLELVNFCCFTLFAHWTEALFLCPTQQL
jgi:hypothetical protein